MDRNMDFNNFNNFTNSSNFNNPYDNNFDSSMYETPMINPIMQYEQAYMYYKYLFNIKEILFKKINFYFWASLDKEFLLKN